MKLMSLTLILLAGCMSQPRVPLPNGATAYQAFCDDPDFRGCREQASAACTGADVEIAEHRYPDDDESRHSIVYRCLRSQ